MTDELQQMLHDFEVHMRNMRIGKRMTSTPIAVVAFHKDPTISSTLNIGCLTAHYPGIYRDIENPQTWTADYIRDVFRGVFHRVVRPLQFTHPSNAFADVLLNQTEYRLQFTRERGHRLCYDVEIPAPTIPLHKQIIDAMTRGKPMRPF